MSQRGLNLRAGLLGGILTIAASLGGHAAYASDPFPGDGEAPPVNINIGMFYNLFEDAGTLGALRGSNYSHNTHISEDIMVGRYIRTFDVAGFLSGVQIFQPYVAFLGAQEAGISNIASAAPGLLPAYGPGTANLSANSGFAQPNLGIFSYLLNSPATGTYAVVAPWIDPPISGFNKNDSLNPGQNVWTYELELGFRTVLFGTPSTQNLTVELWSETYGFGSNKNSAIVSPEVSADDIPAIYAYAHANINPAIPDTNPLQASSVTPAKFNEQPSQEFRIYLPYQFLPQTLGFVGPGFYQSFGGKQTYTLANGAKLDSGNRTEESQLRIIAGTFLSPTTAVTVIGEYDIAAHGEPLNRNIAFRFVKFF